VTKRRLIPKQQQFVEDYIAELNKPHTLAVFDKISVAEMAKRITSAMEERTELRDVPLEIGVVFPDHLVVAHAKYLTFKWFTWSVTEGNRQLAIADLTRRYRSR
jgi:hypothetical protein